VVGSGLVALDAIQILTNSGVQVCFVSSTHCLHANSSVLVNGQVDSTFLNSQGDGGMAKFWAGQMMRMEPNHFIPRPGLGFPSFIDYETYYQASKIVEHNLNLWPFELVRQSFITKIFSRKLKKFEVVFSQFVKENIYEEFITNIQERGVLRLPPMRVLYFQNVSSGRVEVICKNLVGKRVVVICKELFLAAGTIGNTEIVLRSKNTFPGKFHNDSPIGKYLVDHPIINLGSFKISGSRFVNFKVNQSFHRNIGRIKTKYRPSQKFDGLEMQLDGLLELAPRFTSRYENNSTMLRKFQPALNLLFLKLGIDFRLGMRLIDVTLHLEQQPRFENYVNLDSKSENLVIEIELSELDYSEIDRYSFEVENALALHGYRKIASLGPSAVNAYHLSGSLRMGLDPTESVTNLNGVIHGNSNVRILGLATFPTTGFTNPTFSALVLNRLIMEDFFYQTGKIN
jgi:hypothetical protein